MQKLPDGSAETAERLRPSPQLGAGPSGPALERVTLVVWSPASRPGSAEERCGFWRCEAKQAWLRPDAAPPEIVYIPRDGAVTQRLTLRRSQHCCVLDGWVNPPLEDLLRHYAAAGSIPVLADFQTAAEGHGQASPFCPAEVTTYRE